MALQSQGPTRWLLLSLCLITGGVMLTRAVTATRAFLQEGTNEPAADLRRADGQ